jgi:hypothetical protein
MVEPSSELKEISLFWPRLFSGLGIAVAAFFPFVERLAGFLSTALRYPNVAAALGSIVSLAFVGNDFLKRRPVTMKEIRKAIKPPPNGVIMIIAASVLIAGYVGYGDFLAQSDRETSSLEQTCLLLWYLACVALLARGFWRLAFRMYATQKNEMAISRREQK